MDDILKQFGNDPAVMAQLMKEIGGRPGEEEELAEDEKMENVYMTYKLFIQNQLKYTAHTVEWLPISKPDTENSKFDWQYFLLGTHKENNDEGAIKDQLQLARLRIPNAVIEDEEAKELSSR